MFSYKYCYDDNGKRNLDDHIKPSKIVVITRGKSSVGEGLFATGEFIQFSFIRYVGNDLHAEIVSLNETGTVICKMSHQDIQNMIELGKYIRNHEDNFVQFNLADFIRVYVVVAKRIKEIENALNNIN